MLLLQIEQKLQFLTFLLTTDKTFNFKEAIFSFLNKFLVLTNGIILTCSNKISPFLSNYTELVALHIYKGI